MKRFSALLILGVMMNMAVPRLARGDEGMWLFNRPPREQLAKRYDFQVTDEWLKHVQHASVRFNSGGSGSFVSGRGLVMTNHHVGADALAKLSTPERDLVKDGYHARKAADELKCVDLELNVLMDIEDVTAKVNAAVPAGAAPTEAQKARQAVMNTIEKQSLDKTGLRSDVVTLYQGGLYHLYRYKKYTDVRLVFAPEKSIAFFGGDPDNFEYPRYDLDCCFFRVYEDGKPVEHDDYLRFSTHGLSDEELVFVSGHPGKTDRQNTYAHLCFLRDLGLPLSMNNIRRREVNLQSYSERSLENARRGEDELFMYQNTRKARLGGLDGLQNPLVMQPKLEAEQKLRKRVAADTNLQKKYGDAWDQVEAALALWQGIYDEHYLLERAMAFNSQYFMIARTLVRLAEESEKPNAERLHEYAEAGLDSLKQELFSTAPIYADLETVKLADSLGFLMELLGAENDLVQKIMAGKGPQDRAAQLTAGSTLADVAVRRTLFDGNLETLRQSQDPMIQLAFEVDGPSRNVRKIYDEKIEEPMRQAYAKIAQARFAIEGQNTYPDATFTLRLAFGQVRGYDELGRTLPPWTVMGGAYEHAKKHGDKEPFLLPASWRKHKDALDLDTPFNFVSTVDIIGGNSGSPVINRKAEVVGLIFDGNLESLVWDFAYSDEKGRAISVDVRAILESLDKIYDAGELARELRGSE
ncbi:MAG TPA: S46 family peptidase [Pirellulales bacterium]|jgi:hypothetical protein|nr:S46 family peptidase [Pirellulales bacterium]